MTLTTSAPTGFRIARNVIDLGKGREVFETAGRSLATWQLHERAGLRVAAAGPVSVGAVVVLVARFAILYLTLACRVVYIVDAPNQQGFAYGTLDHHVERGEELFLIERDESDRVRFTVVSYSRPGHVLTALSGPIARSVQRSATKRYLDAMTAITRRSM